MTEADVAVVREMIDAFNREDYEASTALLHDEIELHQAAEIPDADTYIGKENFLHGMARWLSGFERGSSRFLPEEVIDCAPGVYVRVGVRGSGRGSGVPLEREAFHIYEVRDGKVLRIRVFFNEADARRAAGLER